MRNTDTVDVVLTEHGGLDKSLKVRSTSKCFLSYQLYIRRRLAAEKQIFLLKLISNSWPNNGAVCGRPILALFISGGERRTWLLRRAGGPGYSWRKCKYTFYEE